LVPRRLLVPAWRSSLVGIAATEVHLPGVAVAPDLDVELLRERVDAAHAHAVQAAGDLVGGGVELAAGVQLGEHHLHGRHLSPLAASIMSTGMPRPSSTTVMELSTWMMTSIFFAIAGQRLVHGVVDHLVDQVMQAHFAGRADVHGGRRRTASRPSRILMFSPV
jgi:hypothetical protein